MQAGDIRSLLENAFPGASVDVHGPDGVHFEARIVTDAFAGKAPLARHRMVYAALGDRMGDEIHALALRTLTPEEARGAGPKPVPGE
jgi:acid stress-induced BolA-like protein IbaG/YrbA